MKARFDTTCSTCEQEIKKNTEIEMKDGYWIHAVCPDLPGKTQKPEIKKETKKEKEKIPKANVIKLTDPFQEAEIIVNWVKDRSYKICVHSNGITDFSVLKKDYEAFKNFNIDLKHTENNLLECVLRLRELNNIKSEYVKDD